jgi:lipase ATG15
LRHVVHHGTHKYPNLRKQFDISDSKSTVWIEGEHGNLKEIKRPLMAQNRSIKIQHLKERRISAIDILVDAAQRNQHFWTSRSLSDWNVDTAIGPNVTDKDTILTFALMMANAYEPEPQNGDWKDVGGGYNNTFGFGWDQDGIRGYIYTNEDSSIVVISIKGGSVAIWDGGGTVKSDKENVNLLFSCCCGQGSYFYRKVCDCSSSTYICNSDCIGDCLGGKDRYYAVARELYANVAALYPTAQLWLAGHSLGGAMSALLSLTYGTPAVTFETPPDALPASRLGLPVPRGMDKPQARSHTGLYQFGVSSDPIYTGTCHGPAASCSYAGYAFESSCHTGNKCIYDVVKDWGWKSSITTHGIARIIKDVIMKYDLVPECEPSPTCEECVLWKETHGPYTTTALSTTSKTRSRTLTCRTPGWWGCLDKSTSVVYSSTSDASTTQTCQTPGWFGCSDKATTARTTSTALAAPTRNALEA